MKTTLRAFACLVLATVTCVQAQQCGNLVKKINFEGCARVLHALRPADCIWQFITCGINAEAALCAR